MQLKINTIWMDEDKLIQVRISFAGGGRQSWSETYCYAESFRDFGQTLIDFPSSTGDEARLELGSADPAYADHLVIRAFVVDGVGHCAIEFKAETRGDELYASSVRFAAPTEAASLNEMGRQLVTLVQLYGRAL